MQLTERISRVNFYSYLWHASFLALAQNFMDVNTIIPAMMIDAGGSSFQVGILTAIMIGGTNFSQLIFLPMLSNKSRKKGFLLFGINLRILALIGLSTLLFVYATQSTGPAVIWIIFALITLFAVSGSFAGISYADILGRSIYEHQRKPFFSLRQAVSSAGMLVSAYFAARILAGNDYPYNYAVLFLIAAVALTIASFGFWNISEMAGPQRSISGLRSYLGLIVSEIKSNRRLSSYLLLVNTLGVSLSLLPFLTLYGKAIFAATDEDVGVYLLFQVLAGVLTGGGMFYFADRTRYSRLLYVIPSIALAIPISLIIYPSSALFPVYFFAGGVMIAAYKIAIEGVLLEVSNNQNRTIYVGLAGAGSIIPAIFPMVGGWMVHQLGFNAYFIALVVLILCALVFIRRLDCQK
jgi:MFS family permease